MFYLQNLRAGTLMYYLLYLRAGTLMFNLLYLRAGTPALPAFARGGLTIANGQCSMFNGQCSMSLASGDVVRQFLLEELHFVGSLGAFYGDGFVGFHTPRGVKTCYACGGLKHLNAVEE